MTTQRQDYLLDQLGDAFRSATHAAGINDPAKYQYWKAEAKRIQAELTAEYWRPKVTVR